MKANGFRWIRIQRIAGPETVMLEMGKKVDLTARETKMTMKIQADVFLQMNPASIKDGRLD